MHEEPAHTRSSCVKPTTTILQQWLAGQRLDTMTVPTRLMLHVHTTGDVRVVEIEAQGSSAMAKRTGKTQPATLLEDALPSQALSEDGTCSVWPLKGGPDLQLHLADVPKSCWTIPWQGPTAAGSVTNPLTGSSLCCLWGATHLHLVDSLILPGHLVHSQILPKHLVNSLILYGHMSP